MRTWQYRVFEHGGNIVCEHGGNIVCEHGGNIWSVNMVAT